MDQIYCKPTKPLPKPYRNPTSLLPPKTQSKITQEKREEARRSMGLQRKQIISSALSKHLSLSPVSS